ncbi:MAG: hypothetical protein LBU88_00745 [Treponema sp.]|jgi:hypothetical protein|nr:hypothetical protein [Treponema sp.]
MKYSKRSGLSCCAFEFLFGYTDNFAAFIPSGADLLKNNSLLQVFPPKHFFQYSSGLS